jgi:hypothetical protein
MKKFILSLVILFWSCAAFSQYQTFYVVNDTIMYRDKSIAVIYPELKEVITLDKESDDMTEVVYNISRSLYPNVDSFLIYYRDGEDLGVYSDVDNRGVMSYGDLDDANILAYYEFGGDNNSDSIFLNKTNDTLVINNDKLGVIVGYIVRVGVYRYKTDIKVNIESTKTTIKLFRDISSEELNILKSTFGNVELIYDYPLDSTGHLLYDVGKLKNESLNMRILGRIIGVVVPLVGYSVESTPLMIIGVGTSLTMEIMSLVKEYRSNKLIQEAGINMQKVN